jgi:hypothetical protein
MDSTNLKIRPRGTLPNLFLVLATLVACTINIYDRRFYDRNDIGLYYNTLETIVIDDPSLC